ncbi:MAG: hypothetical protein V4497_04030 [Bacteroidota bacterium]
MEPEAKIISKHNLDCSTLENLANDIANRLNCNIEYGQYQNENGKHNYVALGTVEVKENGIMSTLYDLRNNKNSDYNFVLELGEEAKVIYKDFVEFMPAWEEQYENVASINNKNGLANNSLYNRIFDELQKLGADIVYFIKDAYTPALAIPENAIFDNYLTTVQQNATFFEVVL